MTSGTTVFGEKPVSSGNLADLLNGEAKRLASAISGVVSAEWSGILAVIDVIMEGGQYQVDIGVKSSMTVRADGSSEQSRSIFVSTSRQTGLGLDLIQVLNGMGYRTAQVRSESNGGGGEANVTFEEAYRSGSGREHPNPNLSRLIPGVGGPGKFPF